MSPKFTKKPTGHMEKLYQMCKRYANYCGVDDIMGKIDFLARECLNEGIIDGKRYTVVQYRMPLPDFERETLKDVGKRIGVTKERVRVLEGNTYIKIQRKLRRETEIWFFPEGIYDKDGNLVLREV